VFRDPRFDHGVWQLPVNLESRVVYLDLAFERERVAVELDGAEYHHGRVNRARDMRRDAALIAMGWVVLRYSYQRLHAGPETARREVYEVLCMRRQLAA
jgi:very-short-patch-repair endonuclease